MELLERYLHAVGRYLPKDRRDDILAEMRANILSLVEDREAELDRALTLDEEEAILKQHGHPMLVASRYLPQQYLIGPTVFPFYWHVLKVGFPWLVFVYVLAQAASFIFQPFTLQAFVGIAMGFLPVVFYLAGWVTIVFACMEYAREHYVKNGKVLYAWSPRKLPEVEPEEARERKTHPIFDFVGSVLTLAFFLVVRQHPFVVLGPGIFYANMFRPTPIWLTVYNLALIFISIQLLLKLIAIFAPAVRSWRVAIDLTTKASAIIIIAFLLRTREYVMLGDSPDAARLQPALQSVNFAIHLSWKIVLLILALQFLWAVGKLVFPKLQQYPRALRFHC